MKRNIKKIGTFLLATAAVLALTACDPPMDYGPFDSLYDSRDGKTYKTVKIGEKVWMAENLNFDYNHGRAKSYCYENKPENCEKYGRLYTWAAAMDSAGMFSKDGARCGYGKECDAIGTVRGVCPEGWHLPSKEEFEELRTIAGQKAGDRDKAGIVLKSTTGWAETAGKSGGIDALGFAALPAGSYLSSYLSSYDVFSNEGKGARFWSSTEYNKLSAYGLTMKYNIEGARVDGYRKDYGFSVRCIKN